MVVVPDAETYLRETGYKPVGGLPHIWWHPLIGMDCVDLRRTDLISEDLRYIEKSLGI
jgi:hypothetical protein